MTTEHDKAVLNAMFNPNTPFVDQEEESQTLKRKCASEEGKFSNCVHQHILLSIDNSFLFFRSKS